MIRQSVCGFDEEIMREFNHLAHGSAAKPASTGADRAVTFCSIDQAATERRQEAIVENIGWRWPFSKFVILAELVDRPLEPG